MDDGRTALIGTFGPRSADELVRVLAEPEAARCDLVELRLDLVPGAAEHIARLVRTAPVPVLATCRRATDGGGFTGSESERLQLLADAVGAGAAWVDIEDDVPDHAVAQLRGARLLRSLHVQRLPEDLDALVARLLAPPAAAAKLVAHRGDEWEVQRLLRCVAASGGRLCGHVVAHPFSRYSSCLLGAPLAYAALRPGGRIGLPIPTVPEMLDRADLARARTGTRAWVLVGADVERSVSPEMLNSAFRAAGADVVALRWSCADPRPALTALREFGWAGCSVTLPHKVTVHDVLCASGAVLGEDATATGAVNTVLLRDGALFGDNTDLGGLTDALLPAIAARAAARPTAPLEGRGALVLGAGGAARAAVIALRRLGADVAVHARRLDRAAALTDLGAHVSTDAESALAAAPAVVVDATPAGPPGGEPVVDLRALPAPAIVMDMLVAARPTALLAAAAAHGHVAVRGLSMLAAQAARQVHLVLGARADTSALQTVGDTLLASRARRVVLLGLRCSGKSAVGARVAALLQYPFVDTDDAVAQATGRSPDEMIRAGEESAFRAAEREALIALAMRPRVVVATGGGAALAADALDALCASSLVVLLDAADAVLLRRLAREPRAALTSRPPIDELARQRFERMPMYESRSDRTELTDVRDEAEVAESIAAWVVRETTAPAPSSSVPSTSH